MERMAEINVPTWLEDPAPAFAIVKMAVEKGMSYNLDEERKNSKLTGLSQSRRLWRKYP